MTTTSGLSADTQALMAFEANKKSMGVSYLIWFFLGAFGGHRFYLGQTGTAVAQLLLFVFGWLTLILFVGFFLLAALGIWWLIDAALIPGIVNRKNDELMARLNMSAKPTNSTAEDLAKYAALRDSGAITDDEYAAQKARLLG